MAKKKQYYDISNMLKTEAQYMMLLGQRANGKSYQAKKTVITSAYKGEGKFVLLRRWHEDIKAATVEAYFADMPIEELTNGEYSLIIAHNGILYLGTLDDEGKRVKGIEIGRYCALNEAERYKSMAFVGYKYILYEEFITDRVYLPDEPRKLQQFVSTVARHELLHVLLIGNTLSRVCPYFAEWCLEGVLKQKIGTIEVYHFHLEDSTVDIAVEYCANANYENKMFFGQTAKQIVSGEWDTMDLPKLLKPKDKYEKVYEVMIEYQAFKFIMELLIEPEEGGSIVFVYPFTGSRKVIRIITKEFSDNIMITSSLDPEKIPEAMMIKAFRNNKVCYSDNLTGSDFNHVREYFKF